MGCPLQLRRLDMATAVISLASSVVGGLLVLASQWLIHRSDDRRYWRGLLRDAAADFATSFSQEGAGLNSDRGRGKPPLTSMRSPTLSTGNERSTGF